MRKLVEKTLAILLSLAMVITMVPGYAWADDGDAGAGSDTESGRVGEVTFESYFQALSAWVQVENNADYPWAVDETGTRIYSTNKGVGSKSYGINLTARKPFVLSFAYECSSEARYDKLLVAKNGTNVLTASGVETGNQTVELMTGDVVTLNYSKDYSGDKNDDCIYLSNFAAEAMYTVAFDGIPSNGTIVLLDGDGNQMAVKDGSAGLKPGSYTYRIDAFGYESVSGSFEVTDADLTVPVSMMAKANQRVTFNVTGLADGDVAAIKVSHGSDVMAANEDGSYSLSAAEYTYEVSCYGYKPVQGTIQVAAEALTVDVVMEDVVTFEKYFEDLSKYAQVENNADYPFAVNLEGTKVYSTNNGISSKSYGMTITATKAFALSFAYECSSEATYDKLLVAKNGSNVLTASGTQKGTQSLELAPGDVVTINYSKDSSGNYNDDCIYLSDFQITARYTITFEGAPAGAAYTLKDGDGNGVTVTDGSASVKDGSYQYEISLFGYETLTGSVMVTDEDVTVPVNMVALSGKKVSLIVSGVSEDTVLDISVTRDGVTYEPSEDGSYNLVDGSYTYKIKAEGYRNLKGSFTVAGEDLTLNLAMVPGAVWSGEAAEAFAAGSGTEADPYQISNGEELAYLSAQVSAGNNYLDQYFVLTKDIDLGDEAFTPIGVGVSYTFRGHFDGQGHSIDGLNIQKDSDYAGLFGYVGESASIANLTVDGSVTGKSYVAGIAGYSKGASYSNLKNYAKITSTSTYAAGIVGYLYGTSIVRGSVTRCANAGEISSGEYNFTGGIAGYTYYTSISDCYNVGSVSGKRAGGIVGQTGSSDQVSNCYNAGQVTCTVEGSYNYGAAIIGYYMGTAFNCYYVDLGAPAFGSKTDSAAATAVTVDQLKSVETITALGGAFISDDKSINQGYPVLAWEDPSAKLLVAFNVNFDDAVIEVVDADNNVQTAEADGTYKLCAGDYLYTVSRTECDDVTGSFKVNGAGLTIDVALVLKTYPLTVQVNPEAAAVVLKDAEGMIQKSDGNVYQLPKGTYTYEVSAYGYVPENGELTITGEGDQLNVSLEVAAKHKVTLAVTDKESGDALTQAAVQISHATGGMISAEADGSYELPAGEFQYLITAEGYINLKGSFVVAEEDMVVTLQMEEGSNVWTGEVSEAAPAVEEVDGKSFYLITSGEELAWFADQVTNQANTSINGKLTTNLLLNSDEAPTANSFIGIGNYTNKYAGTFDGNGKTIAGYYGSTGLFGYLAQGSAVKNVTLSGQITEVSVVGAIANQSYGSISNCVNKADITASSSGGVVGGIVGRIYDSGSLTRCFNEGTVTASSTGNYNDVKVGGIAGDAYCEITECGNKGNVDAGSKGNIYVAGIVGYSNGSASYTGVRIRNCYNQGAISTGSVSNTPYVGGIAGRHTMGSAPVLVNCYNTGSITSGNSSAKLGAIAGDYLCDITNCYYLEGSAAAALGSTRDGYTVEATAMTGDQMKEKNLVLQLNKDAYGYVSGSYPLLLWQGGEAVSNSAAAQAVDATKEALTLEKTVYTEAETIDLPASVEGFDGTITWTSSDETLVSSAGLVTLPETGVAYVTLTAIIALDGVEARKEFTLTVKSIVAQQTELLEAARSYLASCSTLTPSFQNDQNLNTYVQKLLKQKNKEWKDIQVSVNSTGEVTYPLNVETDAAVAEDGTLTYLYISPAEVPNAIRNVIISDLGLTLSLGDQNATVTKTLSLGWDEDRLAPYLQAAVAAAIATMDSYKDDEGDLVLEAGTESIELPYTLSDYPYITFMWASEDPEAIVIPDNTLNPMTVASIRTPEEDTEVQLGVMATFTLGEDIVYNDLESALVTLKSESLSALRQQMQDALDSNYLVSKLTDSVTKEILDPEHVVNDIQLLTPRNTGIEGYSDYRFTAAVDDTDTANVNGYRVNVYRPMPGEAAKDITLTITMSHRTKDISVSKDITVTVDPLTEAELQTAVALMDQVKLAYWNGLNDNFNENQYKITHSLHAFQEAYINAAGELVWVYNVADRKGTGITTGDMADYSSVGGQEAYNKFMSSKPAVIAHENLVLTQPQYNTEVTVSSVLEHELYAKYAQKYTSGVWYDNYFSKLYNIPVSATMTVIGTDGQDPNGEHPATSVTVTVRLMGSDATGAMEKTITTTSNKTIAEAIQEALGEEYTLTVSSAGYIASLTGPEAFNEANANVDYWGQYLLVNEEYDCYSPLTGAVTDGAYYGIISNEQTTDADSFWGYKYDVWFKDFTMNAETGETIKPTVYQMNGSTATAWSGVKVYEDGTCIGTTDANGQISVSYGRPGEHVLTLGDSNHIYGQCTVVVEGEEPAEFAIVTQPADYVGANGSMAEISVEATGEGLSYQWYYSKNGGTKWSKSTITGYNTDTISMKLTEGRVGQMYYCVITDVNGETLTTDVAVLSLAAAGFSIISQPEDYTGKVGDTATFTIVASGDNLTYQWYYSNTQGTKWARSGQTGSTTASLQVPVNKARIGQLYRCVVTDAEGNTLTSDVAAICEKQAGVTITLQPQNAAAKAKATVNFHCEASGEGLSFQWYYSKDGGNVWSKSGMTGSTTDTLSVTAIASRNGQMYRCEIKDAEGNSVNTDAVTLTVK